MNSDLVRRFCTPPFIPFREFENRALTDAEKMDLPFEGEMLAGYRWGAGRTVLLVHGWGSRASHMAFLAGILAKSGFRVVAYDAPAHSSTDLNPRKTMSNMFESCRALHAVAKSVGPLYAIAGHSFGAACAAFTVSGISAFNDYKIPVRKLVLISSPPTLVDVYKSFCRRDSIGEEGLPVLKTILEEKFSFVSEAYTVKDALHNIAGDVLLIHDEEDEEFPVSDIYELQRSRPDIKLLVTRGSGHQKILANRVMLAGVRGHLLDH
jgi:pimeloyl-ACP methyl ester carboxylesterase